MFNERRKKRNEESLAAGMVLAAAAGTAAMVTNKVTTLQGWDSTHNGRIAVAAGDALAAGAWLSTTPRINETTTLAAKASRRT